MRISKFFSVVALTIFAATASAQIEKNCDSYSRVSFGFQGTNFTSIYDGNRVSFKDGNLKGFTAGYTKAINLTKAQPLFLEVGGNVNFGTWGKSESEEDYSYSLRQNYLGLSIPINLTYKLSFSNGIYVAPYAGIHFDLGLLYNMKETEKYDGKSESTTASMYSSDDMGKDGTYNRFQMGYQAGVNLGYKFFNFGIGYKGSILPIYSQDKYKIQNGGLVVTVGYNF